MTEPADYEVGYGKPPRNTRFRKGQSGNPGGRPRGRKSGIPFEAVLGQMVTVREVGAEKRVTAAEAFLLQLAKKGLEGDGAAARQAMAAIDDARARRFFEDREHRAEMIVIVSPVTATASPALEALRMGRKFDRYRPTARMMLEPWIVEAALARLGSRRLTRAQQRVVLAATRTLHNVKWPAWWREVPTEPRSSGS